MKVCDHGVMSPACLCLPSCRNYGELQSGAPPDVSILGRSPASALACQIPSEQLLFPPVHAPITKGQHPHRPWPPATTSVPSTTPPSPRRTNVPLTTAAARLQQPPTNAPSTTARVHPGRAGFHPRMTLCRPHPPSLLPAVHHGYRQREKYRLYRELTEATGCTRRRRSSMLQWNARITTPTRRT